MFASLTLKDEKRTENSTFKYEPNRTKLRVWKNVANEKCTAETRELSSVKNLFWVNHATIKLLKKVERKIFGGNIFSEKVNWLCSVILENWRRIDQKTPKTA